MASSESGSSSCRLSILPVELIIKILDELDFRALLACKRVRVHVWLLAISLNRIVNSFVAFSIP